MTHGSKYVHLFKRESFLSIIKTTYVKPVLRNSGISLSLFCYDRNKHLKVLTVTSFLNVFSQILSNSSFVILN